MDATEMPAALKSLSQQPRVQNFLATAVREKHLSQAYLFVGPPGTGKTEAAQALAQCVICPNGGDGSCDECIRVAHRTHPDVHFLTPESSTGYLIAQIRSVIEDVSLAPVRSKVKVYIFSDAGLLRGAAANALLKTIEEPPEAVMFILIARSAAQLMPTISSRCQQVPFRVIAPEAAVGSVVAATGAEESVARIALAVAGTSNNAAEFLSSPERRQTRRLVVRTIAELPQDDDWDVLVAAKQVVEAVRVPLGELKKAQEAAMGQEADYLSASAMKQLSDANKRKLTVRERSGMMEVFAAVSSLLRDILVRSEDVSQPIVNIDFRDVVDRLASAVGSKGALRALEAVGQAIDNLNHNVAPQLTFEVMLVRVKEALTCPPLSR